ncbi:MAG: cell division FtsZ family protein [Kiritimatiellae bacterium]|nr:cell division FtsZ family protein [Kiritimatiellia bacterium]
MSQLGTGPGADARPAVPGLSPEKPGGTPDGAQPLCAAHVCVVGVGGAGCSVLQRLGTVWPDGPERIAVDTDTRMLDAVKDIGTCLPIGGTLTRGQGTGGDPAVGRTAAGQDAAQLAGLFKERHLVFVLTGLGGGTGTGAAPALVRAAREAGAMTLCYCTLPFEYEGKGRSAQAEQGLAALKEVCDAIVCVPNQKLFALMPPDTRLTDAFAKAGEMLGAGVFALSELLLKPGLMNLDFADLQTVARSRGGVCGFGYGEASGDNKAERAAKAIVESPLLDGGRSLAAASPVLVNVCGGGDLTVREVETIMRVIAGATAADSHILAGAAVHDAYEGRVVVTVLVPQATQLPSVSQAAWASSVPRPPAPAHRRAIHKTGRQPKQTSLLFAREQGRFRGVEPTFYEGENLDIPTFKRRGVEIG